MSEEVKGTKIEQFFVNLYAMVAKFKDIYLTSDYVHYRDEKSAVQRCKDAMAIRKIVKYAHITEANCPTSWEELEPMFKMVEVATVSDKDNKKADSRVTAYDIDAAAAALAKKKAGRKKKE